MYLLIVADVGRPLLATVQGLDRQTVVEKKIFALCVWACQQFELRGLLLEGNLPRASSSLCLKVAQFQCQRRPQFDLLMRVLFLAA